MLNKNNANDVLENKHYAQN